MITIKQVKRLTMTLSWGSLVKPQQMEEHLPRTETSDPASRCSTLTTLSGPFFTTKPKVAFLSWHDPVFSSCGPSCVPDEKVNLLAQTALVNATSLEKYRHLPRNQTSEEGGTLQSPPMSYGGREWNACCSFHWPFIQSTNPERAVAGPAFVCSQLLLENTFRKLHLFF